ncbi:bifunctional phosphoribosylaminoimidazolecarboxamide formyltransferase/IMP cyclohydrolase [Ferroacidibacillus organovorans]|uniref:Bifunctional purine biosynthesis protein PurH n=1 Tax=Ferroacidibacillus organovorans TaxID=1765683 RepID=A0A101XPX7_9BACL|nr:bifunctional phosphoribosylaminoimidazolecarboxamide formyltransferase/IMP cyclohydrolase [Ferroacidibacillus organovorans]KUO95423.1 bifunctional phosphoribosylaminoimidazolecarboxamide formyltransferase/inosine monophosphate cyclohydrolase [Ferroacidibacillus organovorans]
MSRALISVSDKEGIIPLAQALVAQGVEVVSTGGTYRALAAAGVPVTEVAEVTKFPEMMDGRVKTLHPLIHGGLLALRDDPGHMEAARAHQIGLIDYVIVNLYPFAKTIENPNVHLAEAVEQIDIGGPSMLRAAAKNYRFVVTVVDPADYGFLIERLASGTEVTEEERFALCAKVFRHTAAYDARIAQYLTEKAGVANPESVTFSYELQQPLRYGENPHQQAAFYRAPGVPAGSLASAVQRQGKELSFNNIQDAGAALDLLAEFDEPTVVAVKHMNPCGVGTGATTAEAFARAYEADPVSIFGGIVACNREVDEATASQLVELFLEIVIAPSYTAEALQLLAKKKNVRVLELDMAERKNEGIDLRAVYGGLLVQDRDSRKLTDADLRVVTTRQPSEKEWADLLFAWKIVKHVKSNAIVLVKDAQTIGVGAGQMNRVGAARIAIEQAGDRARGAVLASDAFFPMPDTVEAAAEASVSAIIQPGGSIKDQASIDLANERGIAMVFTGIRHFRH